MTNSSIGRREFFKRFTAAGALGLGGSTLIAACGGGETPAPPAEADEAAAPAAAEAVTCDDVSGLSEQEIAMRSQLQYVDVTPDAAKNCENCALFITPAEGAACGGCNLIKGPIAANGYCISWAPKQT